MRFPQRVQRAAWRWTGLALIVLLSVGWVIPLWLGIDTLLGDLTMEVEPRLSGKATINSFPFVAFARDCLQVSVAWLTLVLLAWSSIGASRLWPRNIERRP